MKKLLTALTVSAYLVPAAAVAELPLAYLFFKIMPDASAFISFLPLLLALPLSWALSLASMIGALRAAKSAQPLPFQAILRCRLRLLPFYLLDLVFLPMFGMIAMGPWGMMLVPLVCAHMWWIMAGVSAQGIARLSVLRRQNSLTKCVLQSLLQLIFIFGLIDTFYLAKQEKDGTQ
ncbi:MAG: hypothetical protein FWF60_04050 [Oscillospiraceae bacterium]|nr:hypothetical protein [Oscillospiraceae bacterium]